MEQEKHIPTPEECEQLITRTDRQLALAELVLICLLSFLFLILLLGTALNALVELFAFALLFWVFFFSIYFDNYKDEGPTEVPSHWRLVSKEKAPHDLGNYSREELLGLFEELKDRMKMSSLEDIKLYVEDFFDPNARSHKITRDICIDRSWLRMLEPRELQALMAHELMHLNCLGRWPALKKKRFKEVWALEIAVLPLLSVVVAVFGFWPLTIPFILSQAILVFMYTTREDWVKAARRHEEWLCDWAAAVHVSPSAAINIELKIGHRADLNKEVVSYLNAALKPYYVSRSDINVLVTLVDIKLDRALLSEEELKARMGELVKELAQTLCWELKEDPPEPEEEAASGKAAAEEDKPEEAKDSEEKEKDPHKLDWLSYDDRVKDLSLDEEELERLMTDMKADRESVLFISDPDEKTILGHTHPSSKQRVLFLYENWKRRSGKTPKA